MSVESAPSNPPPPSPIQATVQPVAPPLLRGPAADRIVLSTELDPWLPLRALAGYSGLSVRTLRAHLTDPIHPLPCYRVGTKILVRRSEFDGWMEKHRHVGVADVNRLMAEMFSEQPERTR